jgi:glycosyltransferase involved in cell wall biosynthesis
MRVGQRPAGSLRISVIVPTLREAANLPHVLPRIPDWVDELVLVDGHSTDGTVEVARDLRPDVKIVYQTGCGKGNALGCGLEACTGDIAVLIDADGSTDPGEMRRFVEAVAAGAQLAKGSRFLRGGGSDDITALRRVGNGVLTRLVNLLFRTRYTDLCYGYNALRVSEVNRLSLDAQGFEIETLMGIRAAEAGLNVVEVPSWEHSRIYGRSNLHAVSDGYRVLRTILREWTGGRTLGKGKLARPPREVAVQSKRTDHPAGFSGSRRGAGT